MLTTVGVALILIACGDSGSDTLLPTTPELTTTRPPPATPPPDTGPPDTNGNDQEGTTFEGASWYVENCQYGGALESITAVDELTVRFTTCRPVSGFREIAAFTPFGIQPAEHLQATGGAPLNNPIGTGPWMMFPNDWDEGDSITFTRFDDYWGDVAPFSTLVFQWEPDAEARLQELLSGAVDQISEPHPDDFETVRADDSVQLIVAERPNTVYLAMTNQLDPFGATPGPETVFADVKVRRAIALGIDRQRIVDAFYPDGSTVASHFTPCSIPNGCEGQDWYEFNPEAARRLLAEAGLPNGFDTTIFYRDVFREYLPEPGPIAVEFQRQLEENLSITAEVVVMESGEFIDEVANGRLDGLYLLGWRADYPHVTNFLDFHFGSSNPQFGNPHPEVYELLEQGSLIADLADASPIYERANNAIRDMVPMVPIAHSATATAARASVSNPHLPRFGAPLFHRSDPGKDTFVWLQSAEPLSLYCTDEADPDSFAACQQVVEPLFGYVADSGEIEDSISTGCVATANATVWTCSLLEGVKFHDGSDLDANDVVASWRAGIDEGDPLHVGRVGVFEYYYYLWDSTIPEGMFLPGMPR